MAALVPEIDGTGFDQQVLEANQPVLVDFFAPWCVPCAALTELVAELAQAWNGRLQVVKVNIDTAGDLAQQCGVMGIPTLLLYRGGEPVARLAGLRPREEIEAWLRQALGPESAAATGSGQTASPGSSQRPPASGIRKLALMADIDDLLAASETRPQLVLKHSTSCPISAGAHREFHRFRREHGDAAVGWWQVLVIEDRPISLALGQRLDVRHASPQAILVIGGRAVWHDSHGRITGDRLRAALTQTQA